MSGTRHPGDRAAPSTPLARLSAADLLPHGPLVRLGRHVVLFNEIDSTNVYLRAHAAELPDGTVAWAEYQTAGRGRLGRRWEAPRGAAVLMSVLLHEPADSPLIGLATALAAVAACEAVEQATDCQPALRWPNDLVLAGRKLGGVLVESTTFKGPGPTARNGRALVIGLGLNCLQQRGHFGEALQDTATSLELGSRFPVNRAAVAQSLLRCLDVRLTRLSGEPNADREILAAWRARCSDFGTRIRLRHDRRTFSGTILDVGENGDLLVQLDDGGRRCFPPTTTTRLPEQSPGCES